VPELTRRQREIVAAARALLEEEGPGALTMRALATRIGIQAPSLYAHFAGKRELEAAIAATSFEELADATRDVADLTELGRAYRAYARAHPHLYRLVNDRPLPRDLLPEGVEDRAAETLVSLCGGDIDLARATWAFAHGMTMLELAGRFPDGADLDAAWDTGTRALAAAAAHAED
jgi:AcrR family transcriptional regulator